MIAAGITGATLNGGLEIIAKVRMGKNPQILAETQKILKVKPEIETLTSKQIELKNSGSALKAKLNEKLETSQKSRSTQISDRQLEKYQQVSGKISQQLKDAASTQNTDNLNKLYESAQKTNKELENMTEDFAKETGGKPGIRPKEINGGLKSRERAIEKINSDYNGDASKLVDIAGSKVVYENLDDLYAALEKFSQKYEIVKFKDRIQNPTPTGYRDILMNVRMKNGHIVEFRLHLKAMDEAADKSHKIYQEQRSLEAVAKTRNLSDAEKIRIRFLKNEQIKLHNEAWQKILEQENK